MTTEQVPYFEDKENKFVDGAPIVERDLACCIVYNRGTDEVLCMKWNEYDWKTFVNGGIENGEDAVEGAMREIQEETGYKNLKFICEVGKAKAAFYQAFKKENRITNATGMIFELLDDAKEEVVEEEKTKHLPFWIKKEKIAEYINIDWQLYLWQKALENSYFT